MIRVYSYIAETLYDFINNDLNMNRPRVAQELFRMIALSQLSINYVVLLLGSNRRA